MTASSVSSRPATLGEAIVPRRTPMWRAALLVVAGVALTAVAAGETVVWLTR